MSREHYLPRGMMLAPTGKVYGVRSEPIPVTIDSAVVKALCKHHNETLSPLDEAATDVMNALRAYVHIHTRRERLRRRRWGWKSFTLDGRRFERCLLKCAANASYVLSAEMAHWRPPPALVEMIFGERAIPAGAGFAAVKEPGDKLLNENFRVNLMSDAPGEPPFAVMLDAVDGFRFVCTWERPVVDIGTYENFRGQEVLPHFGGIRNLKTNIQVKFDWSGRWKERENRSVVDLRNRFPRPRRK